jgi:hypothetical protein
MVWHNEQQATSTNNQANITPGNSGQGSFAKQQHVIFKQSAS